MASPRLTGEGISRSVEAPACEGQGTFRAIRRSAKPTHIRIQSKTTAVESARPGLAGQQPSMEFRTEGRPFRVTLHGASA
jgi:hypothetical protein